MKRMPGRPSVGPRKKLIVRIPEQVYAELILLYPNMIDATGGIQYGALSSFFTRIIRAELERRHKEIRDGKQSQEV